MEEYVLCINLKAVFSYLLVLSVFFNVYGIGSVGFGEALLMFFMLGSVFKLKIPLFLGNVKQKHFYKKEVNPLTLFNKKIPIKIACEQYDLFEKRNATYTKENLEQLLYDDIKNQIKKFEFISVEEDDRELITTDKGILLKITYNCAENIAAQDKILFDTTN